MRPLGDLLEEVCPDEIFVPQPRANSVVVLVADVALVLFEDEYSIVADAHHDGNNGLSVQWEIIAGRYELTRERGYSKILRKPLSRTEVAEEIRRVIEFLRDIRRVASVSAVCTVQGDLKPVSLQVFGGSWALSGEKDRWNVIHLPSGRALESNLLKSEARDLFLKLGEKAREWAPGLPSGAHPSAEVLAEIRPILTEWTKGRRCWALPSGFESGSKAVK